MATHTDFLALHAEYVLIFYVILVYKVDLTHCFDF